MLKLFYGTDRVKIQNTIQHEFNSNDYEVIDGPELSFADLSDLFFGSTLFGDRRKILIKDLTENKTLINDFKTKPKFNNQIPDFLNTNHQIIIWEAKIDKRSSLYKTLIKNPNFSTQELNLPELDRGQAFAIFDTALKDGVAAIKMLQALEQTEDPQRIVGAWSWKAVDNFKRRSGAKEKRVLKALSHLDLQLKTTSLSPWLLLQSFLLELSRL